jgi:hypothetical protein
VERCAEQWEALGYLRADKLPPRPTPESQGWLLLAPPGDSEGVPNISKPLQEWTQVMSFKNQTECEQFRAEVFKAVKDRGRDVEEQIRVLKDKFSEKTEQELHNMLISSAALSRCLPSTLVFSSRADR